jgi:hypothetical protein
MKMCSSSPGTISPLHSVNTPSTRTRC